MSLSKNANEWQPISLSTLAFQENGRENDNENGIDWKWIIARRLVYSIYEFSREKDNVTSFLT